jgi:hypothetical protein
MDFVTQFAKWLRGRDLNPRPLGYEDYSYLAYLFHSITYVVGSSCFWPMLARFCCLIAVRFRKHMDNSMRVFFANRLLVVIPLDWEGNCALNLFWQVSSFRQASRARSLQAPIQNEVADECKS